jgi:hypothetical protein
MFSNKQQGPETTNLILKQNHSKTSCLSHKTQANIINLINLLLKGDSHI